MVNKKFAVELAYRSHSDKELSGIDPLTIISIVSIIIKLANFVLLFYTSEEAVWAFRKVGWFRKMVLWNYVKKEIKDRKLAKEQYDRICDLVYNLTEEDCKKLFLKKG